MSRGDSAGARRGADERPTSRDAGPRPQEAGAFSDRGRALLRTFQAAFAALEDHRKLHPDEHAQISSSCASHLKNAAPMSMLDTGPVVKIDETPMAASAISRDLADGGKYTVLSASEGSVTIDLFDLDGDRAVATFTPVEQIRFKADFVAVASTTGSGK